MKLNFRNDISLRAPTLGEHTLRIVGLEEAVISNGPKKGQFYLEVEAVVDSEPVTRKIPIFHNGEDSAPRYGWFFSQIAPQVGVTGSVIDHMEVAEALDGKTIKGWYVQSVSTDGTLRLRNDGTPWVNWRFSPPTQAVLVQVALEDADI